MVDTFKSSYSGHNDIHVPHTGQLLSDLVSSGESSHTMTTSIVVYFSTVVGDRERVKTTAAERLSLTQATYTMFVLTACNCTQ